MRSREYNKAFSDIAPYYDTLMSYVNYPAWITYIEQILKYCNVDKKTLVTYLEVFPTVLISEKSVLKQKEYDNWCYLAVGVERLGDNLKRVWNGGLTLEIDKIPHIAKKLGLQEDSSFQK